MSPGIVIPIVLLPVVLFAIWRWYVRSLRSTPTGERREVSVVRLTAETLRRLSSPPWRVVHEIGDQLPGIDHVVVGPPGVIAITTRVGDRPDPERIAATAGTAADTAITRAALDALLDDVSMRSVALARVFWGSPDESRPAAETTIEATPYVEGQRLIEWLTGLAADTSLDQPLAQPLEPTRVDNAWRAIVVGIGRPDPG